MDLTVIVLTKNEEKNITRCLESLAWCNEILVIDDYSLDKTVVSVKTLNAKVYQRELGNDFSSQRNYGLNIAKHDWVLFVDADEIISHKLAEEIKSKLDYANYQNSCSGFFIKRRDKFMGKFLKYGETAGVKLLRLANKNMGKFKGKVHEVWEIKGKIGEFNNSLIHERNISTEEFLTRIDRYSTIRAKELYEKKVKTNVFLILLYFKVKFMQNYILRFGFLDGMRGFIMAFMMSLHSLMVRIKLYFLWKNIHDET